MNNCVRLWTAQVSENWKIRWGKKISNVPEKTEVGSSSVSVFLLIQT